MLSKGWRRNLGEPMHSLIIGEHIQVVYYRRVMWDPAGNKTQPADARSGAGSRAKKKPLLYNQKERRETGAISDG
jgi:hypothetical protein